MCKRCDLCTKTIEIDCEWNTKLVLYIFKYAAEGEHEQIIIIYDLYKNNLYFSPLKNHHPEDWKARNFKAFRK